MKLETLEYLADWFAGLDDAPSQEEINRAEYLATWYSENEDCEDED